MAAKRGEFSSRFGFLMAATGSAVGLGNIWGFPTNAASNGGAAFLFVYLLLAFALAYPALMAELIIGRHARSNIVTALQGISRGPVSAGLARVVGWVALVTVSLILCFYSVVSGWMIAFFLAAVADLVGLEAASQWLATASVTRDSLFMLIFVALTIWVISAGVRSGIERWASRLVPSLLVILVGLIVYVVTLEGSAEGLQVYLVPDVARLSDPGLLVNALGQAFFSLSLGVGAMLIYGSYVSKRENLPVLGGQVALLDIGIAVLAGLLILPAMYVAQANGVAIYDESGGLIAGPRLIVSVLPALFDGMGTSGALVAAAFFLLLSIASLTSSISMLEVPVSYALESRGVPRARAAMLVGAALAAVALVIVFNFDRLFDAVVALTTEYSQPMLGFFLAIFAGWIWHRDAVLKELQAGFPGVGGSLFWRIWPFYIRFICPLAILLVYAQLIS